VKFEDIEEIDDAKFEVVDSTFVSGDYPGDIIMFIFLEVSGFSCPYFCCLDSF
jgi:hypothetical protein